MIKLVSRFFFWIFFFCVHFPSGPASAHPCGWFSFMVQCVLLPLIRPRSRSVYLPLAVLMMCIILSPYGPVCSFPLTVQCVVFPLRSSVCISLKVSMCTIRRTVQCVVGPLRSSVCFILTMLCVHPPDGPVCTFPLRFQCVLFTLRSSVYFPLMVRCVLYSFNPVCATP